MQSEVRFSPNASGSEDQRGPAGGRERERERGREGGEKAPAATREVSEHCEAAVHPASGPPLLSEAPKVFSIFGLDILVEYF